MFWHTLADFWGIDKTGTANSERTFHLMNAPETWLIFFVAIGVLAFCVFIYRHENENAGFGWRMLMALLRLIGVSILLLIIFQPILRINTKRTEQTQVVFLFDNSKSMSFKDTYENPTDVKKLAKALGLADDVSDAAVATVRAQLREKKRIEIVNSVFGGKDGQEMLKAMSIHHPLRFYTFSDIIREAERTGKALPRKPEDEAVRILQDIDAPDSNGYTQIGSALLEVLDKDPSGKVSCIVLVSDGCENSGVSVNTALESENFVGRDLNIISVGVGDSNRPKDIVLMDQTLEHAPAALLDDDVTIKFDIVNTGGKFSGKETVVEWAVVGRGEDRNPSYYRQIESKIIQLGESDKPQSINLLKRARDLASDEDVKAGLPLKIRVSVNLQKTEPLPLQDELSYENNFVEYDMKVLDSKLRILYVENFPRYEYRFLKDAMIRDAQITVKCFLFQADPDFPQECSDEVDPIKYCFTVPAGSSEEPECNTLEKLDKNFDLIIIGDVNAEMIPPDTQDAIFRFVRDLNKGVIFIAGEHFNPHQYDSMNEPLFKLLPIDPKTSSFSVSNQIFDQGFQLSPTAMGLQNPMLMFVPVEDDPELRRQKNKAFWKSGELQEKKLYWFYNGVRRLKRSAFTLAEHEYMPLVGGKQDQKVPIIVYQQVGRGRSLYLGTDDLWRWRWLVGAFYHYDIFYNQAFRFVTQGRFESSSRFQISVDKKKYFPGETTHIRARAWDSNYEPYRDAKGEIRETYPVIAEQGEEVVKLDLKLGADPAAGIYELDWKPTKNGHWILKIQEEKLNPGDDTDGEDTKPVTCFFDVVTVTLEDRELKMDREKLEKLVIRSGGNTADHFIAPYDIKKIPDVTKHEEKQVAGNMETDDLWDSPFLLLIFLVVFSLEWVLRKWKQLA